MYNQIMNTDEVRKKIERIEAIYADYQSRLLQLQGEREGMVSDFIRKMETLKMEEIRKIISQK
jgi:hypothetical protein